MTLFIGRVQRFLGRDLPLPYWVRGGYGTAFLQALGLTLDAAQNSLMDAVRQTRPLQCFSDALAYLQADRGILQRGTEPEPSIRTRLAQWRQIKRHAGSHYGQMINVQPYFLPARPKIRIVHQNGNQVSATWHTLNSDGSYEVHRAAPSNWSWDSSYGAWSRFWVIIYVDASMGPLPSQWDDGSTWDGGGIWDGYFSAAQIADIISILNESKAAWTEMGGLIFATDPTSFDPASTPTVLPDSTTTLPLNGNWSYGIDFATNTPTRLASAIFAYDLGPL